ncbi:MAG: hypothetical protein IKY52_03970 [Clostridia bacterium]|nr:hypothetical protein [Clostridia bacterium]
MKRFIFIVWILLFLTGCQAADTKETTAETVAVSTEAEQTPLVYVSLGDSIARGYGLDNIAADRFSAVAGRLWEADSPVEVYNYGVDGQTSTELLEMLTEVSLPGLADADVISVSIGANNVLGPAFAFLRNYYLYLYADPVQFTDASLQRNSGISQMQRMRAVRFWKMTFLFFFPPCGRSTRTAKFFS